jgi:hypothetical protein
MIPKTTQHHGQYITVTMSNIKGLPLQKIGNETRLIFKVFQSYNLKVAFKASITLQKYLCQEQLLTKGKTAIYKLNCHTCMGY